MPVLVLEYIKSKSLPAVGVELSVFSRIRELEYSVETLVPRVISKVKYFIHEKESHHRYLPVWYISWV